MDGSKTAEEKAAMMLLWDVNNGVARRSWSGSDNAYLAISRAMKLNSNMKVNLPVKADKELVTKALNDTFTKK